MDNTLLRGAARATLAAAFGTVLLSLPAAANTRLVVGKAAQQADPIIVVNVGDAKGFFKKRGLDLEIVNFHGGSKMIQAMVAGQLDIGDGAGTEMAFIARGVPMMTVCENTSTLPFLSVGVPYNSTLTSIKELKGKKIGVSSSGSLTDWLAKELVRHEGWPEDAIHRAAIGSGTSNIMGAFGAHVVDADIGGTSTFLAMEEKKIGKVLAPVSSYMGAIASGTLFASNKLIETNPDALRAFLAGWVETLQFIRDRRNKEETVKLEMAVTGFSHAVQSKEYDIVHDMYTADCRFDRESLDRLQHSFVRLKLLKEEPDMSKLYTEAYLPK